MKAKKELAAKGEDDIESLVKAIEEERKRQEVKEVKVEAPSHRSNFSMTVHPDNPEIVIFGGEFYNGKTTKMFNDLLVYNIKVTKPRPSRSCMFPNHARSGLRFTCTIIEYRCLHIIIHLCI